jgi:hypothetical protein
MANTYRRAHARCAPPGGDGVVATSDCRLRTPAEVTALKVVLTRYEPDFEKKGPIRCLVCGLPSFRSRLCQRHYYYVRAGKKELPVERMRAIRGVTSKPYTTYLTEETYLRAQQLARKEGLSFSAWAASVLEKELGVVRTGPIDVPSRTELYALATAPKPRRKRPRRRRTGKIKGSAL